MKGILAILFFMLALPAGAATEEEEAARYINIFKADKSLHSDAADVLPIWACPTCGFSM